jgi:hypothetical protein
MDPDLADPDVEDVTGDVRVQSAERGVEERARRLRVESSGDGKPLPLPAWGRFYENCLHVCKISPCFDQRNLRKNCPKYNHTTLNQI